MYLENLTKKETEIVRLCLKAIEIGPFISDDVFFTLLGFEKREIKKLIDNWENKQASDDVNFRIVKSVLNYLTYKEWVDQKTWDSCIPVSQKEVVRIYYKWRNQKTHDFSWDGKVKGVFSKKAELYWNNLSVEQKDKVMNNIFCESCGQKVLISNYEVSIDVDNNLVIVGMCTNCGASIEMQIKDN